MKTKKPLNITDMGDRMWEETIAMIEGKKDPQSVKVMIASMNAAARVVTVQLATAKSARRAAITPWVPVGAKIK